MEHVWLELHVVPILIEMMLEHVFAIVVLQTMVEFAPNAHQAHSLAQRLINASMFVDKIQSTLNLQLLASATLDMECMEVHAKLALLTTSSPMATVLLAQLILITIVLRKTVIA